VAHFENQREGSSENPDWEGRTIAFPFSCCPLFEPNPDKPEPNKDFTTKHTKGTKNEFLMVLWSLRVLRDLRGEQISAHNGYMTNLL